MGYGYVGNNAQTADAQFAWPVRGGQTGAYTLYVSKEGVGAVDITSSPGTITWNGNSGTADYSPGSIIVLTATPDSNSDFNGWFGACSGKGPCQVTMSTTRFVSAKFQSKDRFIDNNDGTIYDTQGNLIWLKNANCFGYVFSLDQAKTYSNGLANGQCGLTDGSNAGDWHLPSIDELRIFGDTGLFTGDLNASGFANVQGFEYYSSTSIDNYRYSVVRMDNGWIYSGFSNDSYVWPVRIGQSWFFDPFRVKNTKPPIWQVITGISSNDSFTIRNTGSNSIMFTASLDGSDSNQFTLDRGTCEGLTSTLTPGGSCKLSLTALATSIGNESGWGDSALEKVMR